MVNSRIVEINWLYTSLSGDSGVWEIHLLVWEADWIRILSLHFHSIQLGIVFWRKTKHNRPSEHFKLAKFLKWVLLSEDPALNFLEKFNSVQKFLAAFANQDFGKKFIYLHRFSNFSHHILGWSIRLNRPRVNFKELGPSQFKFILVVITIVVNFLIFKGCEGHQERRCDKKLKLPVFVLDQLTCNMNKCGWCLY